MTPKEKAVITALAVIAGMCPELKESEAARDALGDLYEAGVQSHEPTARGLSITPAFIRPVS